MDKKKIFSMFCVLLAILMVLSACSTSGTDTPVATSKPNSSQSPTEDPVPSSILNELGQEPMVNGPYELTIGLIQDSNVEDYDTNYYTTLLEEKSGIDIKFELFPAVDAKQKLSVMISGGSELPDIVSMNLSDLEVYTYGSQGYFLPLNDYYENDSFYFQLAVAEHGLEGLLDNFVSADGNIYTVPIFSPEYGDEWSHRFWINQTWLDTLGLQKPKTTDDLYNVLKAFKEQDPNGNGEADEIPYISHINGWNTLPQNFLMNSFIYYNDQYNFVLAENGKLKIGANMDEWKQGLEYINKLYSEGLISPLSFTQDRSQFQQVIENPDEQIVGSTANGSMSVYQTESVRKQDMTFVAPLTGPNGISWATQTYQGGYNISYVTKDAKDPEVAFRLLDLMCETELSITSRFGKRDVDWQFATDKEKGTGLYEDMGIPATILTLNNIWGQPQNVEWAGVQTAIRPYQYGIGGTTWGGNPYDSQYMTAQAVPSYINKAPDEIVLKIPLTTEQNDKVSEISSSLSTYINESTQRFIVGDLPFSEWDNYVAELDAIGLQDYLDVIQPAYDSYKGND